MRNNNFISAIKYLSFYKYSLFLPEALASITHGLILGDLCANKRYLNSEAVLKFCQSVNQPLAGFLMYFRAYMIYTLLLDLSFITIITKTGQFVKLL